MSDSLQAVVRRWRFRVEDEDGTGRYVGPNGEPDADAEWIGTDAEAARESDRRADAWENRPGSGWALRVVRESMGRVPANNGVTGVTTNGRNVQ
jgi:hypothetical protein